MAAVTATGESEESMKHPNVHSSTPEDTWRQKSKGMAGGGGEDTRAALGNLVKEGKITPEEAIAYAQKMGLMSTGIDRSMSLSKTTQLFNFSVYKWSKGRTVQRLILQFDFQSQMLSSIQHGNRTKKVEFTDITGFQSEDGPRLSIQFNSQSEYELDADTQDEKNKMIRLLGAIMKRHHSAQVEPPSLEEESVEESKVETAATPEPSLVLSSDSVPVALKEPPEEESSWPQPSVLPPSTSYTPIREGLVEKKGHSAAFLMWPRRWLKVCEGELHYCRPDDQENALNIIPLNPGITEVKKVDSVGFSVTLMGSRRVFSFRSLSSPNKTAQQDRDEWYQAILNGCYSRRESTVGLRRGTTTAKDIMEERNRQAARVRFKTIKQQTLQQLKLSGDGGTSSPPASPFSKKKQRSQTFSGMLARTRSLNRKVPETSSSNRRSTFYESVDVTTPYTKAVEVTPLRLGSRTMGETLGLLKQEVSSLCEIVLQSSTGSSQVDMTVARIGGISRPWNSSMRKTQENLQCTPPEELYDTLSPRPSSAGGLSTVAESERSSLTHTPSLPSPMDTESRSSVGDHSREGGPLSPVSVCSEGSSLGVKEEEERTISPRAAEPDSDGVLDDTPKMLEIHWMLSSMEGALRDSVISPSSASSGEKPECSSAQSGSSSLTGRSSDPHSPVHSPADDTTVSSPSKVPIPPHPPPPPSLGSPVPPPPPPPPGFFPPGVPPPPPMGGIPGLSLLPPKSGPKPQKKMKRFHWAPLPPPVVVRGGWMEWAKKDVYECLDLKELENLFQARDDKNLVSTKTMRIRPELKTLLDTTRSRNIEIFLPSFPLGLPSLDKDLNEHLNCINESSPLQIEHIVALKRFQPTQEDKEMYKNYKGDKSLLQNADTFLVKLSDIPMLSLRLDLLFTIREFPSNFEGFKPTLDLAWQACRELDTCVTFVEVLQYVLAIGNYLNADSRQGGAYGFKLSVLPKLAGTHGNERRVSLLHYLIQQLHRHQSRLLDLPKQMEAVSKSSDISITSILVELELMQKELDKIEKNASRVAEQKNMAKSAADVLMKDVKAFVAHYREQFHALDSKGQEMDETYRKLLVKFGEPPNTDSEDFFSAIAQFIGQFKKVTLELFPPKPPPLSPNITRRSDEPKSNPEITVQSTEATDSPVKVHPKSKEKELSVSTAHLQANKLPTHAPVRAVISTLSRNLEPKEGNLEKRTKDGKRWEKRYFELERSQLHYYLGKGQKYRDTIRLYGVPVKLSPEDPRILLIETDSRTWYLKAESSELAADWLTALKLHTQAQGSAR